jgi:hypothetical protein
VGFNGWNETNEAGSFWFFDMGRDCINNLSFMYSERERPIRKVGFCVLPRHFMTNQLVDRMALVQ